VRAGTVLFACGAAALVVLSVRFPEWPGPRGLADRRTLLGIPNALDVLSNAPFALAGALGLLRLRSVARELRPAAAVLYVSLLAVALGSSLFHLAPGPGRLLADRLPITLAFQALLALVLGDRVSPRLARALLVPLLLAGAGTALYWYLGADAPGTGDLRPYALVQAVPMVALPLLLLLQPGQPGQHGRRGGLDAHRLLAAFVLYGLAKGAEALDHELFALLGVVSGHTLKHLLAGAACLCLVPAPRGSGIPGAERGAAAS
jgi:hypothetical protein